MSRKPGAAGGRGGGGGSPGGDGGGGDAKLTLSTLRVVLSVAMPLRHCPETRRRQGYRAHSRISLIVSLICYMQQIALMPSLGQWSYLDTGDAVPPPEEGLDAGETVDSFETTRESELERTTVRCVGAGCFLLLALLTFTWVVHAVPLGWVSEAPAFARNLLHLSVAYNMPEWAQHFETFPPPPPRFLDGSGNRL